MAYSDTPVTNPSTGDGKSTTARYIEAIERYDRGTEEWRERCEKINKIYLDQDRGIASPRRFALLWSNVETLKPAVYARLPIAVVSRRFKDADPIGRKAGEVLERCINTTFDLYGVDEVLQSVRDDRLLAARGQAWVRYEAEFEPMEPPNTEGPEPTTTEIENAPEKPGDKEEQPAEQLKSEHVCVEYVHWADFGHSLNRTWPEVTLCWRRVYMTKAKVTKRWDKDKAEKLNYQVRPEYAQRYGQAVKDATEPQAIIYEIWDKDNKQTCWMAKEEKITLEEGDPPLSFRNFFPCPKPTYGTRSTGSLIPTPDYRYYQDQAEEINDLTEKIAALQEWLVLKAFIPSGPSSEGSDAIMAMVQELQAKATAKGIFIPVESWIGFSEKGGSKQIDWLPMDMVIATIKAAIECRQQLVQDVYQITGISDILRGETNPNETLGAQQLKAQTGSKRVQTTQRDLARFARDIAEMAGEIISEVFQPDTMAEMSGFDLTAEAPPEMLMQIKQLMAQSQIMIPGPDGQPQPNQQAQQQLAPLQKQMQQIEENKKVLELLRDEKTRGYRIEIETDSTVEPDESQEKQKRMEFLEATGKFFEQAMPVLQLKPQMAPMLGEMLLFMVRGFRAGRQLEDTIEQAVQQISQQAMQPPPPSPEQQAVELKKEEMQAKLVMDKQHGEQQMALEKQKAEQEMQIEIEKHRNEMVMQDREHTQALVHEGQKLDSQLEQAQAKTDAAVSSQQAKTDAAVTSQEAKTDAAVSAQQAKAAQKPNGKSAPKTSADSGILAKLVDAIERLSADTEIVRGPDGKAVGARKIGKPASRNLQ